VADCCTGRRVWAAAVLLFALAAAQALAADPKFSFVDPRSIDPSRLLAAPPSDMSEITRAELDAMLLIQERRTPAQTSLARADNEVALERFSAALGSPKSLTEVPLPLANALLSRALKDVSPIVGAGKDAYNRPRPYALEKRLKPVIAPLPPPGDSSYPSGNATRGYIIALVLADMVPERRTQLLTRADEYARNRVIAGVHFPSDVEASRIIGTMFTAFLFASPAFESERAAATKELRTALGLPELPPRPVPKT
jgi:acid phosphatase (class A)